MAQLEINPESLTYACADEPIHIPGSVQQHGFFLLCDPGFERVLVASDNAERFLGRPLKLILASNLTDFLDREILGAVQLFRSDTHAAPPSLVTYLGTFSLSGEAFSVVTHCLGANRVLEFERQERLVSPELMNSVITNFVSTLGRLDTEAELTEALAQQIHDLTGFDRIMVYSFDPEGHGTVLSEVNNGRLPSYHHLRFPASDIPAQARKLYELNTVRIIPNADYVPSPLVAAQGSEFTQAAQVDLSLSILRSVSPVHLQYMRNMGTYSSMSVSIMVEGKLWGLVSCHHAEAKIVPYIVRSACDMLTRMASTQLNSFRTTARLRQTLELHAVQRSVLTTLAAEPDFVEGLVRNIGTVQKIANANGVALLIDGHINRHGQLPETDIVLERLADWLDAHMSSDTFSSSNLMAEVSFAGHDLIRPFGSGMLAVRFSNVRRRYILWFRPEVVRTVRWAGEPEEKDKAAVNLSPRNSFAEWKEIVQGKAEPWTETEVDSARDFRSALTTIGLRRAEEAIELGEARFQRLTEALPIKIFAADDDGRLTYTNERWLAYGLSPEGKWFDQAAISAEDAVGCRERWEQSVTSNQPFECEVRLQTPEGQERWNYVRAIPFQRAGAERAGWIGTFVDLTESKEREMALRMNEKLALTGRMTSVIAHEINNPLEAITNLMYLLRSEVRTHEGPAASYIGMVESELERISGITKQTLRWNRETSEMPERFEAGPMTDDVLRLFAGKIRNRQITVAMQGERSVPLYGVIGQVRQVLANLVSNAIDAAPLHGHVAITALTDGKRSGFSVTDDGNGIPENMRKRLFEPFLSTKGDLGNGLGLYISKEIIERHGGTIDVDSTVGKGTTMTVWLPLA